MYMHNMNSWDMTTLFMFCVFPRTETGTDGIERAAIIDLFCDSTVTDAAVLETVYEWPALTYKCQYYQNTTPSLIHNRHFLICCLILSCQSLSTVLTAVPQALTNQNNVHRRPFKIHGQSVDTCS